MNSEQQSIVKEYIQSLSDGELSTITEKLMIRLFGDLPDVLNILSRNRSVDDVLRSADGADELYDMCDRMKQIAIREAEYRKLSVVRSRH